MHAVVNHASCKNSFLCILTNILAYDSFIMRLDLRAIVFHRLRSLNDIYLHSTARDTKM